jgi:hypothetical protein
MLKYVRLPNVLSYCPLLVTSVLDGDEKCETGNHCSSLSHLHALTRAGQKMLAPDSLTGWLY